MRKWKQGIIAFFVSFLGLAFTLLGYSAGNDLVFVFSFVAVFFSVLYGLGLVVVFIFQMIYRFYRKGGRAEGMVVRTIVTTVYECGKCKRQYSNSETCPFCGSPYRRTVKVTAEEEMRSARSSMVR